ALASATLVVGGRRHLAGLAPRGVATVELGKLGQALAAIAQHSSGAGRPVVLASGDPGFFGILRALRQYGISVLVLPSVSTVQRLAATLGRSWDDLAVVSAHGREFRPALNVCRARPAVAVLTAPGCGPAELGAGLAGWRRSLVVAEDIGGAGERLSTVDPASAAERVWREPNLVFCLADPAMVPERGWHAGGEPHPPAGGWALPEDAFSHRDGMISKYEVRAVALARLAPRPGTLVWDVGAGSGAVGVECARLGSAVVAVEPDAGQCTRVVHNAERHGVDIRLIEGAAPASLGGLPAPDAIFVGGGGQQVLAACAVVGATRLVVALAGVDRLAAARDTLRAAGYRVEGCEMSSARLADLPDGASRLAATNPVFLLFGGPYE
ncbi:MAG: precorrin-6y C5,15-methyltransferase (decarboxylating) subunit CbiE, partial [Sciscionella sp.]